jgi:hypothetical protein
MATGASTADLAVVLVDARKGLLTQTRRHSFIADLLGIQHLVIAVNKMDLVGFDQARFEEIVADYRDFAGQLAAPDIHFVPLYYAAPRPVVERDGMLIMVDDERMPLAEGEVPEEKWVRFRTLGCYPLTGAVESRADTLPEIIQEMLLTRTSERSGRAIDHDQAGSMEKKKREGYF